jgi:hypothetical protein
MALIVHKYGGTSMGSIERIKNVARRVAKWHRAGYQVVGITLQLYDHGEALAKKGACCAGKIYFIIKLLSNAWRIILVLRVLKIVV